MATIKARASVTISLERDILSFTRFYRLASSSSTPSAPTEDQGKAYINSGTPVPNWVTVEPAYDGTSTNSLYICDLTAFSDGNVSWTSVSKSSSYEAAKQAYNKALNAESISTETNAYFWNKVTDPGNGVGAGAHVTEVEQDDFIANPSNGGRNVLINTSGVLMRDGVTTKSTFGSNQVTIGESNKSRVEVLSDKLNIISVNSSSTQTDTMRVSSDGVVFAKGDPSTISNRYMQILTDSSGTNITAKTGKIIFANGRTYIEDRSSNNYAQISLRNTTTTSNPYNIDIYGKMGVHSESHFLGDIYYGNYQIICTNPDDETSILMHNVDDIVAKTLNVEKLYVYSNPIHVIKTYSSSAVSISAGTSGTVSRTFTMPSPYEIVIGVRRIETNSNSNTTVSSFDVSGDGETGSTVTLSAVIFNKSTTNRSVTVTWEVALGI